MEPHKVRLISKLLLTSSKRHNNFGILNNLLPTAEASDIANARTLLFKGAIF